MAEYDPQRSRPRRRVTDDVGPAPVDEMLDATPEPTPSAATPGAVTTPTEAPSGRSTSNGSARQGSEAEVVDLAPVPPPPPAGSPRRARTLLVVVVLGLAVAGFVLRRIGAARRARHEG